MSSDFLWSVVYGCKNTADAITFSMHHSMFAVQFATACQSRYRRVTTGLVLRRELCGAESGRSPHATVGRAACFLIHIGPEMAVLMPKREG